MNNYKMSVQYDGTRYSGWQRQGNTAQTIQYKLEQALGRLLEEPIEVSGSGRTDAGVHALGQVANFKTEKAVDCGELLISLNQLLPEDIAVTSLSAASPRFHARLGAKEKTYCYTINLSPVQDVFRRRYEYQLPEPLDLEAMEQAAELLIGTHDFRGFSTGHTKKSTVRYLRSIEFSREGDKLCITFTGNGFLYNMVRILTGTLIEVGQGKRSPDSVTSVFETRDRQMAGFTAPPQGLCLMQVTY
jgi:tRNA pseudouridine38-40 synthase